MGTGFPSGRTTLDEVVPVANPTSARRPTSGDTWRYPSLMSNHGPLDPSAGVRSADDLGYLLYELAGLRNVTFAQAAKGQTDQGIETMLDHFAGMVRRACALMDVAEVARITGLSEERLREVSGSEETPLNWWPHTGTNPTR